MAGRLRSLAPVCVSGARVLILGSMPGRESLRRGQYYAHPKNQFWKILAALFGEKEPENYRDKKSMLARRRIALWDVIGRCRRRASSDSSIRDVRVNDLKSFLRRHSKIRAVFLNGQTAQKYFKRHAGKIIVLPARVLPSSSPARAGMRLKEKIRVWKKALADEKFKTKFKKP